MLTDISPPTLIAEGTQIHGAVTFVSNAHIAGIVEGDLLQQCLDPLTIGRTGWVRGSIQAQGPVLVEGRVEGSIASATSIRLLPTAQVNGKLESPAVKVAAGALLDGEISMQITSESVAIPRAA
jgi:cytoskeletal protein CcmA (bactofilin family)